MVVELKNWASVFPLNSLGMSITWDTCVLLMLSKRLIQVFFFWSTSFLLCCLKTCVIVAIVVRMRSVQVNRVVHKTHHASLQHSLFFGNMSNEFHVLSSPPVPSAKQLRTCHVIRNGYRGLRQTRRKKRHDWPSARLDTWASINFRSRGQKKRTSG